MILEVWIFPLLELFIKGSDSAGMLSMIIGLAVLVNYRLVERGSVASSQTSLRRCLEVFRDSKFSGEALSSAGSIHHVM